METKDFELLNTFAENLSKAVVKQCSDDGLLDGQMMMIEELNEKWRDSAAEYMAAAVPQIAEYPLAAIAWACYMGMGAAVLWDKSWGEYKDVQDWYSLMAKPRGFDEMDEYVVECLVGYALTSPEAEKLENTIRKCAYLAQTFIRKEGFEPQSVMAFHVYSRAVKVFFELGVSLELYHRGYKYVKMNVGLADDTAVS